MHLPNELLDPKTAAGLAGAAASVLAVAMVKVRQAVTQLAQAPAFAAVGNMGRSIAGNARRVISQFGKEYLLKMAGVSSLIFSLQMFNFPISSGTSGHFMGGVLALLLLGPWGAVISMSLVLMVQAFFFADGGIIVLGANIFNLGVVGVFGGLAVYQMLMKFFSNRLVAIALAAWVSVVSSALMCAIEMGVFGAFGIVEVVLSMVAVHALIGIGEAVITLFFLQISLKYFGWRMHDAQE